VRSGRVPCRHPEASRERRPCAPAWAQSARSVGLMKKPRLGILLKPTSFDCNMACVYCYYRGVKALYPGVRHPRMSLEVFEEVCRQYRALEPVEIKIGWQGGEPTLMGLDFFREAVRIEAKYARAGECWGNTLQTNGALLNDAWCEFLAKNRFLVGLSIDGPPELNRLRRFPGGQETHQVAMRALGLLKRHGCEFNVLIVVSAANVEHADAVFSFLRDNELRFSQCIPCTEPAARGTGLSPHSITAEQWAEFMIRFFDLWVEADDPGYYNRHIDNWLHLYFGLPPESCEYRDDCSNLLLQPADHRVERRRVPVRLLRGRAVQAGQRAFGDSQPHVAGPPVPAVCLAGRARASVVPRVRMAMGL